ncbi:hypothetical protein S1R3X_000054 [Vibrio phage vB_ValS_VA-RY-4]|nr:hypothetical protein [Vibrio phage vB_VpaS_VP-RY-9]UFD98262.1 hypothetical protein S1R3X_000054 [Vibrio phage vB_ValS_VA-RY-4]WGH28444.1 hypothetical protein 13VO501A_gene0061 [Vibrio phage 13VO501A]CAH0448153.1 hypothetical protein SM030_00020 [Vibrio phage vB_VpaS_sm030]CAI5929984.1 hypothetical protein SM031_00020 [Vibrio phage vB_VpaS_sm030]
MNTTETLKSLLGIRTVRITGEVIRTTPDLLLRTPSGSTVYPMPNFKISVGDILVIESGSVVYNLGSKGVINEFEV